MNRDHPTQGEAGTPEKEPMSEVITVPILPCPFCGKPGELDQHDGRTSSGHLTSSVSCPHCSIEGEAGWGRTREEADSQAVAWWNRRAPTDSSGERNHPYRFGQTVTVREKIGRDGIGLGEVCQIVGISSVYNLMYQLQTATGHTQHLWHQDVEPIVPLCPVESSG